MNNCQTTTISDHLPTSRAASFADFELLYEINMAKKIFFKSTTTNDQSNLFSNYKFFFVLYIIRINIIQ